MPSIPQGAFAVYKVRAEQAKQSSTVSRVKNTEETPQFPFSNKKLTEYSPVKYNSKLMNSIWGMYNEYSPHNIKKNNANYNGEIVIEQQQQYFVGAAYAISGKLEMAKNQDIWKLNK